MKNKNLTIIAIQSFMIFLLIWVVIIVGGDEFSDDEGYEDDETVSFVELTEDGLNQVRLSEKIVSNSGIVSKKIVISNKKMNFSNYGLVQGTDSLIDLKNINDQLLNEKNTLINRKKTEKKKFIAFEDLNKDDKNISDQALLEQEVILANIDAEIRNKEALLSNLKQKVISQWGEEFYKLITNKNNSFLEKLLQSQARIVKITLPSVDSGFSIPKKIIFSPINGSEDVEGYFVAEAPMVDQNILGQTFYYLIDGINLRIGSKVVGYYEQDNSQEIDLYEIPTNAVVWSNGISWVYVEKEAFLFIKKPILLKNEIKSGWLVSSDSINDSDKIVTKGAQLLLSEEYKYQIKNENED
jgi:hypothetical protein